MTTRSRHCLAAAGRVLVLLSCAALAGPARAAADPARDVEARQVLFWSVAGGGNQLTHGPAASWLHLQNASPTRAWPIELTGTDGFNQSAVIRLILPPATQVRVPCVLPLATWHGNVEVRAGGRVLPCTFHWPAGQPGHAPGAPPALLLSRGLPLDPFLSGLNPPAGGSGAGPSGAASGRGGAFVSVSRAEVEADAWPDDWLFFAAFDAVALASADVPRLPGPALEALVRYAECGGQVIIFGDATPPKGWEARTPERDEFGARYPVGFGSWAIRPMLTATADAAWANDLQNRLRESRDRHPTLSTQLSPAFALQQARIPLKAAALTIALFAVLAGPLNLAFVICRQRRLWLLWTTPLLGVLFSLAVIGVFVLGEGVRSRGVLQAVTLLNEGTRRATTLAIEGLYCPLPPRGGVTYDGDWQVTPLGTADERLSRELDLSAGQCFRRGWVRSRLPAGFALRGSRHAAERLPLRREGDALVAVNGLGAPIERLAVADSAGQLWAARDLAPGAEARLERLPEGSGVVVTPAWLWEQRRWPEPVKTTLWQPERGQYLAVLKESAFIRPRLPRAHYKQAALVIGTPAEAVEAPAAAAGGRPAANGGGR